MRNWEIRPEQAGDEQPIAALITDAFATMPYSDGSEPELVGQLRMDGDLSLSLVAAQRGTAIIGHVGFSPVGIDGISDGWFQLAPLSVLPRHQRCGIGSALIEAGVAALRGAGACGIGVLGDPAYYERFGFTRYEGLGPGGPHGEYYRWLVLEGEAPKGEVSFAPAFG